MTTSTNTVSMNRSVNWGGLLTTGLIAGVVAAVINSIVFFIGQAMGVDFVIVGDPSAGPMPLNVFAVATFSLVPGVVAAVFAGLLQRFTARGASIFRVVAIVFLLVSFLPDILMPEPVTMGTKASLMLMHVIAGLVITYMVGRKVAE